jgi:hypothetical protein
MPQMLLGASQIMGGFGSGRRGGGPTVESALRLDIDDMMQWGGIRAFARLAGEMRFNFYGDPFERACGGSDM